ncbi:aminoglycoside phosphotransferase family protein [Lentzea sp. NPDC051213]|uniref:aminoglycoside phosphotransferase family protein n=1 Tax=Lentzea sp. NPDC051213 TaxID=3364126 RepID=UPI0037B5523A
MREDRGVDGELLRDRLGLRGDVTRFEAGSLPVFAIGDDLVLKLWPPEHHDEVPTEVAVMEALHGKLPVPTPKLHDTGLLDEWAYVLMSRLHGDEPEVPDVEISVQVGEFLDSVDLEPEEPVLLHTEIMSVHLLQQNGKLSGLFDFEPAMRGPFEYEFVGAGIFVTKGDRRCWQAMVDAYGRTPDPRRVLAYTLMHVYSNMTWFMNVMPKADMLDDLAVRWFGE